MNFRTRFARVAARLTLPLMPLAAGAAVITNDTVLAPNITDYDGLDLVVSNAVLTVNGPHAFNSLRVASGATLTHSAAASGSLAFTASVTNEALVLTGTNAVTLANLAVEAASVRVRDTNNLVTYANDVDYLLATDGAATTLQRTTNSTIPDGDTVWVSYDYLASTNSGLTLTVTNDFELEPGAIVQATGRGRGGSQGPGAGGFGGSQVGGAGGGHGGFGGTNSGGALPGGAYGSAQSPTTLGSGGGNGTTGPGPAGGGGGGRIAIYATSNLFAGTFSACGGSGGIAGGAGTIFLRDDLHREALLLDNCGLAGTNTPLTSSFGLATDVAVRDGAVAEFRGAIPAFSNLVVGAGGLVTGSSADTNLDLALLGDLRIQSGGGLALDGKGFPRASGPGAGATLTSKGAGGGHGGAGGASASGAAGGSTYGAAEKPVARGSGGGNGLGAGSGSAGGGALRLAVAGTLALDGFISANGALGLQDDAGGGAGGSLWISAGQFTGAGALAAEGGDGDLFGGGGGGGGRIAVYSPLNSFTGIVSVAAGGGAASGGAGTVFTTGNLLGFAVLAQTPLGVVSNTVSQIRLEFTDALNPFSVGSEDFRLDTPDGPVDAANFTWSFPTPATLQLSFPTQNSPGDYRLETGPGLSSLLGVPLSQVFTGAFSAYPPLLTGTVTDTNGQPVADVRLQPDGDLRPAMTDANGHYALGVPVGWSGNVTPTLGNFMFVPGARSYAGVAGDTAGEDYLMVATIAPWLQIGSSGTNLVLNWSGLAGVTYQVHWTTNVSAATWTPLDPPIPGTNGLMQLELPISDEPEQYFRLSARN